MIFYFSREKFGKYEGNLLRTNNLNFVNGIKYNNDKLIMYSLLMCVMVYGGYLVYQEGNMIWIAVGGAVIGVSMLCYLLRRLLLKNYAVTIYEEGIISSQALGGDIFVKWDNISGVSTYSMHSPGKVQHSVGIELKDKESYYNRLNIFQKASYKFYKPPVITIATLLINIENNKLEEFLNDYRNLYCPDDEELDSLNIMEKSGENE